MLINESNEKLNQIYSFMDLKNPKSFFLLAGAGSGKTRSLVELLVRFKKENIFHLVLHGQSVAVITYTNAACNEIKVRLNFDPSFTISTIHSFSWDLIKPYQVDIKNWLIEDLNNENDILSEELRKGRPGTKAESDRNAKLELNKKKLLAMDKIRAFTYNPSGTNNDLNSLNHSQVIKIATYFLKKPLMKQIFVNKYPILLIDECQDTNKDLLDAFLLLQQEYDSKFMIGLFGDTMQKIYADGKINLMGSISTIWERPSITVNYRSPRRIIKLINKIRSIVDEHEQTVSKDKEGFVRLFVVKNKPDIDRSSIESKISEKMAEITNDLLWKNDVKTLILEHHMAASRCGFSDFFDPLYKSDIDRTGLIEGTMKGIPFIKDQIVPLVLAHQKRDEFSIARIIKKYSQLLEKEKLEDCEQPIEEIRKANDAVNELMLLWNTGNDPDLLSVLSKVKDLNIFNLPELFEIITKRINEVFSSDDTEESIQNSENNINKQIYAWEEALKAPFSQFIKYTDYILEKSPFGTHQGIKGLQFPRVMVVLDDNQARGFLFSYDKLFGAKEESQTDQNNLKEGKETSNDRTRRLFYVTCSRAEESLAIIIYTDDVDKVKEYVITNDWFYENEVNVIE